MRLLLTVVFAGLFIFIFPALGQAQVTVEQIGTSTWHGYTADGSMKMAPIWSIAVEDAKVERSEVLAVTRNGLDGFVWTPEDQGWKVSNYRNPHRARLETGDVSKLVRLMWTVKDPPLILIGLDAGLIGIVGSVVFYEAGGVRVFLKEKYQADGERANELAAAIQESLDRQARLLP